MVGRPPADFGGDSQFLAPIRLTLRFDAQMEPSCFADQLALPPLDVVKI